MAYLLTGTSHSDAGYKLRSAHGYPDLIGAMFWTIDDDRIDGYKYSNVLGPQLHPGGSSK